MTALFALNAFLLFIIAVKIERMAHHQFELDNDDVNYNDWDFGFSDK
jgi:hypothetical protein